MATSGNLAFDPTFASILDEAAERAGMDPAALTQKHIASARASMNFMFNEWQVRDADPLYRVTQYSELLDVGTASYAMPAGAYDVLDLVMDANTSTWSMVITGITGTFTSGETITDSGSASGTVNADASASPLLFTGRVGTFDGTVTGGTSGATATAGTITAVNPSDQPLERISRQQWLDIGDKDFAGDPQKYYVDMSTLNQPTVVYWPVPDRVVTVTYDYMRYIETLGSLSETLDIHRPWYEACVAGLALRLAEKYNMARVSYLAPKAESSYRTARRAFSGNSRVIIQGIGFGRSNRTRRGSTV